MRSPIAWLFLLHLGACGQTSERGALHLDSGTRRDLTIGLANPDFGVQTPDDADTGDDAAGPSDDILAADPCLARARLIYTIDEDYTLRSFNPRTLKFANIGKLNCPAQNGGTPFSMAVDALATAWVLYSDGEIFLVDTQNANCKPSKWPANQGGFSTFGMAFVADAPGLLKEHLFIASVGNMQLASVDPLLLNPVAVGQPLSGQPELTGTGSAQLWGFFPDTNNARVAQLDKMNANEGQTYPLQALNGSPLAWAFAFWGGDFWIFLKRSGDNSTHVWHLTPANGNVTDAIMDTGYSIVGAGVSICAPITPTH